MKQGLNPSGFPRSCNRWGKGDSSGAAFCQAQTWECSIIILGQWYAPAPRQIEPAATTNATSTALEPSWLVVEITATEPINTLTFNAEFLAGADGLVSVFLNENLVGSIDQRVTPESGIETHELYLGDLPAGHYKLAFRLDQYGTEASEVELTEIELGWMELVAGPMMTLTKAGDGSGMVLSDPPGITCGVDCVQGFPLGEVVTLTAQPEAGNRFAGWSGACSGTQPSCRLTVSAATQICARFESETTDPGSCSTGTLQIRNHAFTPGQHVERSDQRISTFGQVVIQSGAEVTFEAPTLTFGTGFEVEAGARFTARATAVNCNAASATLEALAE